MEKKRWSLIFIGLCLALAFSVSPVEAQKECDADDDSFVKDTNKCRRQNPDETEFDCNDNVSSDDNTDCGDPEPAGTVDICHFKNILKHCVRPDDGVAIGGGVRTINDDLATIARHEAHGDCVEANSFIINPTLDPDGIQCGHHCVALDLEPRCGPVN